MAGGGQGLRCQLKGKTPSTRARLKYIMRQGDYAKGREGPRDDLAGHGSGNLPPWAKGRPGRFWRAVDQFERAKGRKCVELELNLPGELTLDQQHAALRAFAKQVCGSERLPFTYAIHAAPGNPHSHFMIQERGLDGIERTPQGHFKRASNVDPSLGGARKSRAIHGWKWIKEARAAWAETLNAALLAAGHAPRFNPHRKSVQAKEALRAGDLRRYGELRTITEKHEGPKVHGMRQRWRRGDLAWDDIPEGAQATIRYNDNARAYNNALRDWLRSATDEQLAERFGAELRERDNPSAHVAAWVQVQHALALDEDRDRTAAAALVAGELELLTAAQIEAAERAELVAFEAEEQAAHLSQLAGIEHLQALDEDRARSVAAAVAAGGLTLETPPELRPTRRQAVQQRAAWYVAHEFGHWDAVPRIARAGLRVRQPEPPAVDSAEQRQLLVALVELADLVIEVGGPDEQLQQLRALATEQLANPAGCPPIEQLRAARDHLRDEALPAVFRRSHAAAIAPPPPPKQGATEAAPETPKTAQAPAVTGLGGGARQSFLAGLARLQEHQDDLGGDWIDPDQPVQQERHDPDEIDLGGYESQGEIDLGDGEDWGEIDLDDDAPAPSSRGPRLR